MVVLIYTGSGAGLIGVPARDLTEAEARKHGGIERLIATGLYKKVSENKAVLPTNRQTKAKE